MVDHEDDPLDRDLLAAFEPAGPRDEFVDRVMARIELAPQPHARPRVMPLVFAFGLGVALAAAIFLVVRPQPQTPAAPQATAPEATPAAAGELVATERTTTSIGDRAIVVAEPGARLSWRIDPAAAIGVEHREGTAFYRVERGEAAFRVHTSMGTIEVIGTCFTVDAIASRTQIAVHEGRIRVVTEHAEATFAAGERVRVTRRGLSHVPSEELACDATGLSQAPPAACLCAEDMPRFEPTPAQLREWADECRVHFDTPLLGVDDEALEAWARRMDANDQEIAALIEAFREVERASDRALARMYADATGDERDDVPVIVMFDEVMRSAEVGEDAVVRRKLARERAGLDTPPRDLREITPYEELERDLAAFGDRLQAAVATRLGPARAYALRKQHDGWPGSIFSNAGCPE